MHLCIHTGTPPHLPQSMRSLFARSRTRPHSTHTAGLAHTSHTRAQDRTSSTHLLVTGGHSPSKLHTHTQHSTGTDVGTLHARAHTGKCVCVCVCVC
jgi:hypothetical protein